MLVVLYWGAYTPLIRHLDAGIKRSRALLLLFPDEVSRVVPAIVAAAHGWAGSGSGGGDARNGK